MDAPTGQRRPSQTTGLITRQWTGAQRRRMVRCSPAVYAAAHLALIALGSYGTASVQLQGQLQGQFQELPFQGRPPAVPTLLLMPLMLMLSAGLGALSVLGWRGLQSAWFSPVQVSVWAGAGLCLMLAALILLSLHLRLFWRLDWRGVPLTLAFTSLNRLDVGAPGHARRVARQAEGFGRALGLPQAQLRDLWIGALLHDIGKAGVPDEVLLKPGPLSLTERHSMERHVDHGVAWGRRLRSLPAAALCVISAHHERWDGAGYPLRLHGEEIPLSARIVTLCDVFDALTHDRVYKPAWSAAEALQEIERQAGRAFDPLLVQAFAAYVRQGQGALRHPEGRAA